jgi:CHAD domain-containing protein
MHSPAPRLLPRLAAALASRRTRIESILARSENLSSPAVLHDLRVALRRTGAVAKLTRDFPAEGDGEALRTAARDLRRALTGSRTREVARRRLVNRFRRDPSKRRTAERLAKRLGTEKEEAAVGKTADARLSALRRAFAWRDADLARLNPSLSGIVDSRAEKTLRKTIQRRLRKKRRRLLDAGIPAAETVHPLRIAAKDLRYSLELVSDVIPGASGLLHRLQEFQDVAGDAHDRAELIAVVRRVAGRCPPSLRRDAMRLLPVLMRDAEISLARAQASSRRLLRDLEKTEIDLE